MRRRSFIALCGVTAASWPLVVHAQTMRRAAVVLGFEQGDQEGQSRLAAFVDTLARLGWSDGRNVRLDIRWAGGNIANYKAVASEIAGGFS
jgi:putative tryptophan/tyrosine transport system substrate-binding protein